MVEPVTYRNALPAGTKLAEYRLDSVLGAGGFGMTYLARDTHLDKPVAIKEFLPVDLAVRALDGSIVPVNTESEHDYKWGLERFIQEARTLARFSHPNIVRVNRYFEANGTGYMVMDYEEGESLSALLKRTPRPDEGQVKALLAPLLDGLEAVHEAGFLHRDIKPSNIFLRKTGTPVLLDFGSARKAGGSRSLTSVLTPGYAPLEQYASDGHQGPWSDIYAMGGVLYRVVTDQNPPDAVTRHRTDTVAQGLAGARDRYGSVFLQCIEWALRMDEKHRPQRVSEWRVRVYGDPPGKAARVSASTVATTVRMEGASRRAPEPKRPSWRWVGIAALILVAAVAGSTWYKQRQAAARQEAARMEAEQAARLEAARPRPPGPAASDMPGTSAAPATSPRERPGREREARPGNAVAGSRQDLRGAAENDFRSADANGDGYLSRDEVERFPFIAREFGRVDRDGDGRISEEEFLRLRRMQAERLRKP